MATGVVQGAVSGFANPGVRSPAGWVGLREDPQGALSIRILVAGVLGHDLRGKVDLRRCNRQYDASLLFHVGQHRRLDDLGVGL